MNLHDKQRLSKALADVLWQSHDIGDTYKMDGVGGWKIAYYPIFECGQTLRQYDRPRALVEKPKMFGDVMGTDFREVPMLFLSRENV